jgi:hypothetical protein
MMMGRRRWWWWWWWWDRVRAAWWILCGRGVMYRVRDQDLHAIEPRASFSPVEDNVYYVDNSVQGSGTGTGTSVDPWRDIASHIHELSPGDTMYVRGGSDTPRVYGEDIVINVSGEDNNRITLRPYGSELVTLRRDAATYVIDINGHDYWTIDGFTIDCEHACAAIWLRDADHHIVRNCTIHSVRYDAGIIIRRGDYNVMESLRMYDGWNGNDEDCNGIAIRSGTGTVIRKCTIYNFCGDCVLTNNEYEDVGDVTIEDCVLHTTLGKCSENALDIKQGHGVIRGCTMYGFQVCPGECGGTGANGNAVSIHNDATTWLVEKNEIYDCTGGMTLEEGCTVTVRRNVIRDLHDDDPEHGDPLSDAENRKAIEVRFAHEDTGRVTTVDIYNNTFDNCPGHLFRFNGQGGITVRIKNNIFNNTGDIHQERSPALTYDYNCWRNATGTLPGVNDMTIDDPGFVHEAGNDLRLRSVSLCRNKGVYESPVDYYYGTAPDMGRYEYDPGGKAIRFFGAVALAVGG